MNILQRMIVLAAAVCVAANSSFAQTYTNTPNDTVSKVGVLEDLETLSIQQLNISADAITLKWEKVSESVPLLWEAAACDNATCNSVLVEGGTMNPVYPAEYGLLLLHITPHTNYGTAIVRYAVWDIKIPSKKDTLTYILTVKAPSGISQVETKNAFSIYPNPAKQNIRILSELQSGFRFLITDALGNEIHKGWSDIGSVSVNTASLPDGVYNVSLYTADRNISTGRFIIQH